MAIVIQSSFNTQSNNVFVTGVTLNKPSGTIDGDLLIAYLGLRSGSTAVITPPAGWTQITSVGDGTGHKTLVAYYKVASSEPSSWNWGFNSSEVFASVLRITGADILNPIPVFNVANTPVSVTALDFAETITPTSPNNLVLFQIYSSRNASGLTDISNEAMATDNPTWTELYDLNVNGTDSQCFTLAYATRAQTTATGHFTATQNGSSPGEGTCSIALALYRTTTFSVLDTEVTSDTITAIRSRVMFLSDIEIVTDTVQGIAGSVWNYIVKPITNWLFKNK